jgi:hypothetical protein
MIRKSEESIRPKPSKQHAYCQNRAELGPERTEVSARDLWRAVASLIPGSAGEDFWTSKSKMNSSRQNEHSETWSIILFFFRMEVEGSKELMISKEEGHPFLLSGFLEALYP